MKIVTAILIEWKKENKGERVRKWYCIKNHFIVLLLRIHHFSILFSRMTLCHDTERIHSSVNDLYLEQPCAKKKLLGNESFGFGSMQGWRRSQEDSAKHLIPFDKQLWKDWTYYAIFDGHNGIQTAKNAADLLDNYLVQSFKRAGTKMNDDELDEIIKNTFIQLDKHLSYLVRDHSGSVCVCI